MAGPPLPGRSRGSVRQDPLEIRPEHSGRRERTVGLRARMPLWRTSRSARLALSIGTRRWP